ncbi:MAG: hypothetical protein ABW298_17640 [Candidatus Binatia bacterium]
MTSQQARLFANYILGMDEGAAVEYVRFSAFRLDDTFFDELRKMIDEARGARDTRRQRALDGLLSLASDACGRAYAPFKAAAEAGSAKPAPQDDYSRAKQLFELDRRVTAMMMRTHFNPVNDAVIADWKNIVDGYRELVSAGPPKSPYYNVESVNLKIAQSLEALARACGSIRNAKESRNYYKQAAKAFEEAGQPAEAARCRATLRQDKMAEGAQLDDQIRALLTEIEVLDKAQPEYFARLVDLGELQSRTGDDFAAEKTLLKAESGLETAKWRNPSGVDLADALVATLKSIGSGGGLPASNIQTSMLVRDLHRRIHLALAEAYQRLNRRGDAKKAKQRLRLAEEMDRSSPDDDFSTRMRSALSGELKNLLR